MTYATLPAVWGRNLSRYLQYIRRFPLLSHEEKLELAQRW
jgi:hypothetical protein